MLRAEEQKNEKLTQELEKVCEDLNQEQDTNNNLLESLEVGQTTLKLKTEQMDAKIHSRDKLIKELENAIFELSEQVKRDQLEIAANAHKNSVLTDVEVL